MDLHNVIRVRYVQFPTGIKERVKDIKGRVNYRSSMGKYFRTFECLNELKRKGGIRWFESSVIESSIN